MKLFLKHRLNLICTNSFAKNFGLYGERIGSLHFVTNSKDESKRLMTNVKLMARVIYSSPPLNGSRIVSTVLKNNELRREWEETLNQVIGRMKEMRKSLKQTLEEIKCPCPKGLDNWNHITTQTGMFCFTGLTVKQSQALVKEYDVYLTSNGRISVSGMNTKNVAYVAKCFKEVMEKY